MTTDDWLLEFSPELPRTPEEQTSHAIRLFARVIQDFEPGGGSGQVSEADSGWFWDTYGLQLVTLANYIKYGHGDLRQGLEVYQPALEDDAGELKPVFVRRRRPDLRLVEE